jgi:hypothetical protein
MHPRQKEQTTSGPRRRAAVYSWLDEAGAEKKPLVYGI